MQQDNIQVLIKKYFAGTINADERKVLEDWYNKQNNKKAEWLFEEWDDEERLRGRIFHNIEENLRLLNYTKPRQINWYRITAAAAVVFILFYTASYFWQQRRNLQPAEIVKVNKNYNNDIAPGSNKAVLTLGDGSHITLDDSDNGIIGKQGNTLITKQTAGKVVYDAGDIDKKSTINNLTTPRGGQYQLVLADGTKVWLNSESSLSYPSQFTGNVREVILTGEAYFEVAKNEHIPFQVKVNGMQVNVLGTHFNIKAYSDEYNVTTTLLEGSVKVVKGTNFRYITPGQQALVNNNSGTIAIHNADVDEVMAWQKGYYVFKSRNIKSIMQEIGRWYNIEVEYKGAVDDLIFSGKISRFKNISEVLGLLELTGDIHFKVEGRRVTVMP